MFHLVFLSFVSCVLLASVQEWTTGPKSEKVLRIIPSLLFLVVQVSVALGQGVSRVFVLLGKPSLTDWEGLRNRYRLRLDFDAFEDLKRYSSLSNRLDLSLRNFSYMKSQYDQVNAQRSMLKVDLSLSLETQKELRSNLHETRRLASSLQESLAGTNHKVKVTQSRLLFAMFVIWNSHRAVSVISERLTTSSKQNASLREELGDLNRQHASLLEENKILGDDYSQSMAALEHFVQCLRDEVAEHQNLKIDHQTECARRTQLEKDLQAEREKLVEIYKKHMALQANASTIFAKYQDLEARAQEAEIVTKKLSADLEVAQRSSDMAMACLAESAQEARKLGDFFTNAMDRVSQITHGSASIASVSEEDCTMVEQRSIRGLPTPPHSAQASPAKASPLLFAPDRSSSPFNVFYDTPISNTPSHVQGTHLLERPLLRQKSFEQVASRTLLSELPDLSSSHNFSTHAHTTSIRLLPTQPFAFTPASRFYQSSKPAVNSTNVPDETGQSTSQTSNSSPETEAPDGFWVPFEEDSSLPPPPCSTLTRMAPGFAWRRFAEPPSPPRVYVHPHARSSKKGGLYARSCD